eukprot:202796_1
MFTMSIYNIIYRLKGSKHGNIMKRCIQRHFTTSPFPLRPGYGLGSMIPAGLIEGMKKEAKVRSKILVYGQIESDLESMQRELLLQKNQIENNMSSEQTLATAPQKTLDDGIKRLQTTRDDTLTKQIEAYDELSKLQESRLDMADKSNSPDSEGSKESKDEAMAFTTFDSSIESPVEWGSSRIDYLERAQDSIQINAHFFDVNQQQQSAASHASNVAGEAG